MDHLEDQHMRTQSQERNPFLVVRLGAIFALLAAIVQAPQVAITMSRPRVDALPYVPFQLIRDIVSMSLSGLMLYCFGMAGFFITRLTRRMPVGVLASLVAGIVTGTGVILLEVAVSALWPNAYTPLVTHGSIPWGFPGLSTADIARVFAGYMLVSCGVGFVGALIAHKISQ